MITISRTTETAVGTLHGGAFPLSVYVPKNDGFLRCLNR